MLWGKKDAKSRAEELFRYALRHIEVKDGIRERELFRIFYYDCPPLENVVWHPLLQENVEFRKSEVYQWTLDFLDCLRGKRKMALRLGRLAESDAHFRLDHRKVRRLCNGNISVDDLSEKDFSISFVQKGVDMRMGVDITTLAYEGRVSQIILISGDSDFVPAAKVARRKGVDFILDPMGNSISSDLYEHIDGLESFIKEDPVPVKGAKKKGSKAAADDDDDDDDGDGSGNSSGSGCDDGSGNNNNSNNGIGKTSGNSSGNGSGNTAADGKTGGNNGQQEQTATGETAGEGVAKAPPSRKRSNKKASGNNGGSGGSTKSGSNGAGNDSQQNQENTTETTAKDEPAPTKPSRKRISKKSG